MEIKKFDASSAAIVFAETKAVLELVAKKHGMTIDMGKATYNDGELRFKTMIRNESYVPPKPPTVGEGEDVVGKTFTMYGITFTVTNYLPAKRKFPIVAKNGKDGKEYQFPLEVLK